MRRITAIAAVLAGALVGQAVRADTSGGLLLRGTIVTMGAQGTVAGAVHVKDGKVAAVLPAGAPVPDGATVVDTKGFIYPGLLNLHDHVAYNFLPLYPVPKHYTNRDQWPSGKLYEELVNNPKNLVTDAEYFGLQTEALKYAEVKALAGGETAIQGCPVDAGSNTILVRNVEMKNFGSDLVGERGLSIDKLFVKDLAHERDAIGKLDAWFFHLSEGIDDYARREYSNPAYVTTRNPGPKNQAGLKELGLLLKPLVGIHCTALHEEDFADWDKATGQGPRIVWSPLSNLLLYGQTTDIPAAMRHHATVALGTDWSPSGSKNLLWELKVADQVNKHVFKGALADRDLVAMVTCNPARLLNWQDKVGSIAPGMVADLVVIDDVKSKDGYRNLIEANEANVQLVLVGGAPIYGDAATLGALVGANGCEALSARPSAPREKAVVIKYASVSRGDESFQQITSLLTDACSFDPRKLAVKLNANAKARAAAEKWLVAALTAKKKDVADNLNHPDQPITDDETAAFLALKFPYAKALPAIDTVFECSDDGYFAALENNIHFKSTTPPFDPRALEAFRGAAKTTTAKVTLAAGDSR